MRALFTLFLACSSCAGSFEAARLLGRGTLGASEAPSTRCMELDDDRALWGALGKAGGVIAGSEGLATIPIDDKDTRAVLGATALGVAAFSVAALIISDAKGAAWARECSSR